MKYIIAILFYTLLFQATGLAQSAAQSPKPSATNPHPPGGATPKSKGPTHLHVRVLAKAYEDSIVIRWAPADPVAWLLGKDSGYRIARIDYSDPKHPVSTMLSSTPFKPLTLEQMKATLNRDDKYAAIAAQALYGNDFRMTKDAPTAFAKKIKQGHDALNFRHAFALEAADFSPAVASAIALRWVDKDVKKGNSYIYVVTVNGRNRNYVVDSAAAFIVDKKEATNPAPDGLRAYGFDRKIELHWNRRQLGNFTAYYIERSDDGGATFHTLNKLPFYSADQPPPTAARTQKDSNQIKIASVLRDHQIYFDSIPQDYVAYNYRVRGINAFAELSPWSAVAIVQGRDLTAPTPPVIDSAKNSRGSDIKITWTQRKADPDLAGYYVSRASSVKGPFYPLTKSMLPKNTKTFTDTAALPHLPNYYVVIAVDTAKNVSASAAYPGYLTDTVPPAAPIAVAGTIDSNGVVYLHWAAGKEPDLKGYKVYYAYNPKNEFSQITHTTLTDTSFTDTISQQSLNRRIWYKVVAVDRSNNHSAYSAPAALKKIVVVPPSAPVAGDITIKRHSVTIEWIESRSEGAAGYEIFRKQTPARAQSAQATQATASNQATAASQASTWTPIARLHQDWSARSLHFTDTSIAAGTDYYYAAETIDSTGSRSERSFAVHVRSKAADSLLSPTNLQAKLDSRQHHVRLSWQYKDTGDYFFVVYRSVNNGTLDAWQSFDKTAQSGEDAQVASGTYSYAIKVVHRDRAAASAISKPIQLLIQ